MYQRYFDYWMVVLGYSAKLGKPFFESLVSRFEESWVLTTASRSSGIPEDWSNRYLVLLEEALKGVSNNSEAKRLCKESVDLLSKAGAVRLKCSLQERLDEKIAELRQIFAEESRRRKTQNGAV